MEKYNVSNLTDILHFAKRVSLHRKAEFGDTSWNHQSNPSCLKQSQLPNSNSCSMLCISKSGDSIASLGNGCRKGSRKVLSCVSMKHFLITTEKTLVASSVPTLLQAEKFWFSVASLHVSITPVPSSFSWPCAGQSPACPHLSWAVVPRAEPSISDVSCQRWTEGKDNLPPPAGNTLLQAAFSIYCCRHLSLSTFPLGLQSVQVHVFF